MQTEEGRGIVEDYYEIAPGIVMMIDNEKGCLKLFTATYISNIWCRVLK